MIARLRLAAEPQQENNVKNIAAMAGVAILLLAVASAHSAAQTRPPASQTGASPGSQSGTKSAATAKAGAPKAAFNRKLLNPANLSARAPETFDAKFTTTKGDFVIRVTRAWSPNGADRFYNLVRNGYYNNASFFRVVSGFMVQFGISAYPEVNRVWMNANIKDDPVRQRNTRGKVTFAMQPIPNSRTTQVFINFTDRNTFLDSRGFAPFGEVVEGMEVVDRLYSGYGDGPPEGRGPDQGRVFLQGKAYLDANFPRLDSIQSAVIVGEAPAAAPATAEPAKKSAPPAKPPSR
jgi:peptidyl-prolyl cis-trans isomerase A (cyclophilin A)